MRVRSNYRRDWSPSVCPAWCNKSWLYYLRDSRHFVCWSLSRGNYDNNSSAKRLYQVNIYDAHNCSKFLNYSRMRDKQYWYCQSIDRLKLSDRKRRPRSSLGSICILANPWLSVSSYILSEWRSLSRHSWFSVLNIYCARYKWSFPYWQLPNHSQSRSDTIYRLYLNCVGNSWKFIRLYSVPQPLRDHGLCGYAQNYWDSLCARHTGFIGWIIYLRWGALLWLSWDCDADELASLRDSQLAQLWFHCSLKRRSESHWTVYG